LNYSLDITLKNKLNPSFPVDESFEEHKKGVLISLSPTSLKVYVSVTPSERFGVINKYKRMRDFVQWKVGVPDE